ncbi:hypothetical protein LINPERPRIM_LOCUS16674 [Linum perenne]
MEPEQSSRRMPFLRKMMSWSPETERDEVWRRRKDENRSRRRNLSVTDDDLDELKACIELGFGFDPDSPDLDPRLSDALPALGFYCAVNKQYNHILSRTTSEPSISTSSDGGDSPLVVDTEIELGFRVGSGEDPEMVKARLRQWARVVACSVKQITGSAKN